MPMAGSEQTLCQMKKVKLQQALERFLRVAGKQQMVNLL